MQQALPKPKREEPVAAVQPKEVLPVAVSAASVLVRPHVRTFDDRQRVALMSALSAAKHWKPGASG